MTAELNLHDEFGQEPISEKVSEKATRGRPAVFSQKWIHEIGRLFPEVRSTRGRQETAFMAHACTVIARHYEADPQANAWAQHYVGSGGRDVFHKTILAALGRLSFFDESRQAEMLEAARFVAEKKLTTDQAVTGIRRFRLGRDAHACAAALERRIRKAIADYLTTAGDLSWDEIEAALQAVLHTVQNGGVA